MDLTLRLYLRFRYPRYRKAYRLIFDPDGFHHYPGELKSHLKGLGKDELASSLKKDLATYLRPEIDTPLLPALEALAEGILALPRALDSMIEIIHHGKISKKNKMQFVAVVVYLVSPVDVIPEGALRGAGYADDAIFASIALNAVQSDRERQTIVGLWTGERRELEHLYTVASFARESFPELYKQVYRMYERVFSF